MSEPAISLDDAGYQNLRAVADRLLETTRVEYVDEGVLLIMNPPGIEHRRIVRAIVDDAKRASTPAPSPSTGQRMRTTSGTYLTALAASTSRISPSSILTRRQPKRRRLQLHLLSKSHRRPRRIRS
jgi:hypothetical protein